ncbi:MAG: YHS domain-containing (seleno)protein [Granulosicoccus sp.]
MKMTTLLHSLLLVLSLTLVSLSAGATEPVAKSRLGGVAIGGHDSVAYHELGRGPQEKAVAGVKSFTVEYKGAKWRFASQEDSELFAANPEKYSPAYNGHCANALSLGEGLIRTDGTHWEIFEDKLYLFYAARGRNRWNDGNWQSYKIQADTAWKELSN